MYIYLISIFSVKATQIYTKCKATYTHAHKKTYITDDREKQKITDKIRKKPNMLISYIV